MRSHKNTHGRYKVKTAEGFLVKNLPPSNTLSTLGLDGTERPIRASNDTVCGLCKRMINKDDECLRSSAKHGSLFYLHTDCVLAEMTRAHVKNLPKSRGKRRHKDPEPITKDITIQCKFCYGGIEAGSKFIKYSKKEYHFENQTQYQSSCWMRFKAANRRLMMSV